MTTTISNKRTLADIEIQGEGVTLRGHAEMDENNRVIAVNGDILKKDLPGVYVGNFSLLGVNINETQYVGYRTEASELIDRMVREINEGTATIQEKEDSK